MSHHASGPDFGFPRGDARLDMTDLYAFTKPGDPGKSIIILNVHPSMAVNPVRPTTRQPFAPGARYTKSKLIQTAMPLPTCVTAHSSLLLETARRPRQFAGFRAREPLGRATRAKS